MSPTTTCSTSHQQNRVLLQEESFGPLESIRQYWQRSYFADYAAFTVLLLANAWIGLVHEPFHQMFSLDDLRIQHPHAEVERVGVPFLILYTIVLPLAVILAWAAILRPTAHKLHVTILGFLISVVLTTLVTDIFKNAIGRPRPDLLARCKPRSQEPMEQQHRLVTIDICTERNHHLLHDGWRSFPSGHSSLSFGSLGYLSLFLTGQMRVFRPHSDLGQILLSLLPLMSAALIAISRLEDYRHDPYDVTAGSLIGLAIAFLSYTRYYPAPTKRKCDKPYLRRAEYATCPKRKKDDEASIGIDPRAPSTARDWSSDSSQAESST